MVAVCTLVLTMWSSFGGVNFASPSSAASVQNQNVNVVPVVSAEAATSTPKIVALPVVKVVDGDTIDVKNADGKIERIRLLGINTPEVVDPRKPVECFGKEASARLHVLLDGKSVVLTADSTQQNVDKYGRLLRYVSLEDGKDIDEQMIREGFAHEYTYDIAYERQAQYRAAEREAQNNKRGLWADGACVVK